MRLHGGGVDEHLSWRTAGTRQHMEQINPHALCRPTDIAVVEGLVGSVDARRIDLPSAGLQHVDDAADHPAVIDPSLASCVGRQVGPDTRELIVRKPEAILVHERPPDEAVNHKTAAGSNGFMGPNPKRLTA